MSEIGDTFLCGSVLFFMLMKATYPDGSSRDHKDGVKDEHKAPDVMSDLVYTFTGSRSYGSEKDTSNYREGKIEGTVNVPFNDEFIISAYENTVKSRYDEALGRMCEFTKWHINPALQDSLVRALLEVIEHDRDIKDEDVFYCLNNGSFLSKVKLGEQKELELEPFLVGVLLYILRYRCGKNSLGAATLDLYGTKVPYKERVHKGNAGKTITRKLTVTRYNPVKSDYTDAEDDTSDKYADMGQDNSSGSDCQDEDTVPKIEGEVVNDEEKPEDNKGVTIIHHQTNVVQNGENNYKFTNNGVMNFDFGGRKKRAMT